jgi:hypothetical protein
MVLCIVKDQIFYGLKNIIKSFSNLDLYVSINPLYQYMMGYKKFLFFEFTKY